MLEGTLILVVTVVLVIVVAGGVVAALALSRRSADDWKGVIKREREEITQEVRTHSCPSERLGLATVPSFREPPHSMRCCKVPIRRAPILTLIACLASTASKTSPVA